MAVTKNLPVKRRCVAVTVAGEPCRAWAVRESEKALCSAHLGRNEGAGAPPGNQNAVKHGFYAQHYREDEVGLLLALSADDGLDDEIAAARVALLRVVGMLGDEEWSGDPETLGGLTELVFKGAGTIGRLVKLRHQMSGSGGALADVLDDVLDALGAEWGLEL